MQVSRQSYAHHRRNAHMGACATSDIDNNTWNDVMLICVTVLILKHDLFNYFHIGNVNTQNNVDEPGPQLVVEPPPQGLFPLSAGGVRD